MVGHPGNKWLGARPALVGEAIVSFVGKDEMIEQGNAEEVASVAQAFGEHAIFRARRDVARGMIVSTEPGASIHQDERLKDFARMDNG